MRTYGCCSLAGSPPASRALQCLAREMAPAHVSSEGPEDSSGKPWDYEAQIRNCPDGSRGHDDQLPLKYVGAFEGAFSTMLILLDSESSGDDVPAEPPSFGLVDSSDEQKEGGPGSLQPSSKRRRIVKTLPMLMRLTVKRKAVRFLGEACEYRLLLDPADSRWQKLRRMPTTDPDWWVIMRRRRDTNALKETRMLAVGCQCTTNDICMYCCRCRCLPMVLE